ncbi:AzlC family ABC transporter permease [Cryptosporangium sp. NPDC048952]|uniref:AzlC family ABC transporter permease n=1 Tax=Cryptosporangium sp. NPDC048952 TaxID=3363961 RepID=UPI00371FAA28
MVDLRAAARESGVIWAGLFALGIGLGVLVTSHDLPWWLAPALSATVFAGSAEFILVGMLAAAAPVATIALTTFLINSRHLFYGLSFPLHRVRGRLRKVYSVFALIDEAYVLLAGRSRSSARMLWTQFGLHASWVAGSLTGALAGNSVLSDVRGMGFVLTALFVVLTLDAFRARPDWVTAALAAGSAGVALVVAPGSMLLVAMTVFTASLAVRHYRHA